MPIPPGITRDHVLQAISQIDSGRPHAFAESTKYDLIVDGKRFAPKAVVAVASELATGHEFKPSDFSGGNASGQANYVLRELGFDVELKPGLSPQIEDDDDE